MTRFSPVTHRFTRAVYRAARGIAYAGIGSRPALSLARLCGVKKAAVFMFHRFADGKAGQGTDITMLRQMLTTLRKQGLTFMRMSDLLAHVAERRELPGPTAVFTVDDGYAEFEYLAAPIFEGFDSQPTVFVVTDFMAGGHWNWWDRITESFVQTRMREIVLTCGGHHYRYDMTDPTARRANARAFTEALKWVPDVERVQALAQMGEWLDVGLADTPPPQYASLGWDAVRRLERSGVDFAPHSMTHPMLSRVSECQLRSEVQGSWSALQREAKNPTPIFCYPNGSPDSFGQREIDVVRESGLSGAVAFRRRYVEPGSCHPDDRYSISRFPVPHDVSAASYLASGLAWDEE
jgi:peptidoglycan/xylan/chitin deacetylase (PgdA/CDA1 family)